MHEWCVLGSSFPLPQEPGYEAKLPWAKTFLTSTHACTCTSTVMGHVAVHIIIGNIHNSNGNNNLTVGVRSLNYM